MTTARWFTLNCSHRRNPNFASWLVLQTHERCIIDLHIDDAANHRPLPAALVPAVQQGGGTDRRPYALRGHRPAGSSRAPAPAAAFLLGADFQRLNGPRRLQPGASLVRRRQRILVDHVRGLRQLQDRRRHPAPGRGNQRGYRRSPRSSARRPSADRLAAELSCGSRSRGGNSDLSPSARKMPR